MSGIVEAKQWLNRIDEALVALDEKPQFALPSPFPLEEVEALFRKLFDHQELSLKFHQKGWFASEKLWDGLGEQLCPLMIEMTPLEEPLYFVLSEQDLAELMCDLLGGESASAPFYDRALASGFYHYLALEILQTIEEVKFAHPLSPRIGPTPKEIQGAIGKTPCFVIDTSMELSKRTVWGRLLIPAPFRQTFKAHFASSPSHAICEEAKQKIPVTLTFEVGHTELNQKEYESLAKGKYVILDRCSFNPDGGKGSVTVLLGETPLFRGKFKKEGIELVEYPHYEEIGERMEEEDEIGEEISSEEEQTSVSVEDLPVHLKVEVGKVRMTLQELGNLNPGNLIELNVTPEQGVDLVVSGKKVGRGELIRIGETLGVRIISI
ncbi:MAG: hypothetical protein S4CHLAM45_11770 [Chlamydiales bacterium]|nr:hypothetical protein [Chlamydiales bacterium]MCH9619669.1 hypothetical protein [Chlamydiales bacterium]MCH9623275.1 hypothetical protein [Chlamydiales bacterium]